MKKNILIAVVLVIGFLPAYSQPKILQDAANAITGNNQTVNSVIKGVATFAQSAKAADNLTPENEYYLGRAVAANIAGTGKIYRNPALDAYLNKICTTIVINSQRPDIYNGYHVAVLDTDEINAFATPGGHIFVTRGLIACASSEDALAAVIAHEVAHIQLRHALTSIRNARYVNAAASGLLAGVGDTTANTVNELTGIMGTSVDEIITSMVVKGFSKKDELEADATALSLLAAAGYDPSGMLTMLEVLKDKQGKDKKSGFGKTHPTPAERITAVKKNLGKYKTTDTKSSRTGRFSSNVR